jgi:hypothetical protein
LKLAGSHALVRWQLSQEAVVTMCRACLPAAREPLWQAAQVPGATFAWLKLAGTQALVRWQLSQEAVVAMWLAGLPEARAPVWQLMQAPGCTATWLKRAPAKVLVLWQDSQGCCPTGTWFAGITVVAILRPSVWQDAHCRGVPRNTPRRWQLSQRTERCAPVSANPVPRWSKRAGACAGAGPGASSAAAASSAVRNRISAAPSACRCAA